MTHVSLAKFIMKEMYSIYVRTGLCRVGDSSLCVEAILHVYQLRQDFLASLQQ